MALSTEQLEDKHLRLMTSLGLYGTIWEDIDPNLLLLAFIHRSGVDMIPSEVQELQESQYLTIDYEWHEFIGDAVIEMIVTTIATELHSVEFLSNAHLLRQEIVRNLTLYCYMVRRGLCREIIYDPSVVYDYKMCADMFEAIIGVLYWWGYYIKGLGYEVIHIIRRWLTQNWFLQETVMNLLDGKGTGCGVTQQGYGEWSGWSTCPSATNEQKRTAPCLDNLNCRADAVEVKACPVIRRTIPSTSSVPNGFMSISRFEELGLNAQHNRLNYEINQLLKNPSIRGHARTKLTQFKRESYGPGKDLVVIKRKVEALAARNGYSIA